MPRKKLIRTSTFPYHVTTRCNNKEWFYTNLDDVYGYSLKLLSKLNENPYNAKIHAFVLMSNHYHLLIETPLENIDKCMQFFNKKLSIYINYKAQRINHVFGGRYFWSIIKDDYYYACVTRYIYQNPLRSNIVSDVEEYKYSTLQNRNIGFKLRPARTYSLKYLNRNLEKVSLVRKGLSKSEFKISVDRKSGKIPKLF